MGNNTCIKLEYKWTETGGAFENAYAIRNAIDYKNDEKEGKVGEVGVEILGKPSPRYQGFYFLQNIKTLKLSIIVFRKEIPFKIYMEFPF